MTEISLISAFVFLGVLLGVQGAYWSLFRSSHITRSINRRLELSKTLPSPSNNSDALRDQQGFFGHRNPLFLRINDYFAQTGLRLDRNKLLLILLAHGAAFFVLWSLIISYGPTALALSLASVLLAVGQFFRIARNKRIARFSELLPDGIDVLVRAVRVGYPLPMAINLVAREMPEPIGSEFAKTFEEISFGQDIRTATENLYRRVGQEDLSFLVVAINVQVQTGGNLAEILSRLSRLIRNRSRLRLKIRSLSAEGRMSAIFLSLMPFILFGGISMISPGYFSEIRDHALVAPALIYSAASLIVGNIVMYRMVNFNF